MCPNRDIVFEGTCNSSCGQNHTVIVTGKPGRMVSLKTSLFALLQITGDAGWESLRGWEEDS